MTGNNRLAIISAIAWIAIFILLLISRTPAGDRIAQSVDATLQARPVDFAATPAALIVEPSPTTTITPATPEFASVVVKEPEIPCLYAKMVMESIPDGTHVSVGGSFTKTWVLENTGSCTWTPGFRLVFTGGEPMNGPEALRIGKTVAPGERVTISVDLSAPSYTGSCRGNWMLESDQGVRFAPIWLQIDVVS
jgi:hypothetical protein